MRTFPLPASAALSLSALVAFATACAPDTVAPPPGPAAAIPAARPAAPPPLTAAEGEVVVEATGVASGTDDAAIDRAHATRLALREAVEKVFVADVEPSLAVAHRRVVRERVVGRAPEFVRTHQVLSQETRDRATVVTVRAAVARAAMEAEVAGLRAVLEEKRLPRVLVLMGPADEGDAGRLAALARAAVEETLRARGFPVVAAPPAPQAAAVVSGFDAGDAAARARAGALGGAQDAEVVVVGRASLVFDGEKTLYGTVAKFYAPEVSLAAVGVGGGEALFSEATKGEASARADALEKAARALAQKAGAAVAQSWQRGTRTAAVVVVRVRGISFEDFARLRRAVEDLRGVQIVRGRPFSGDAGELEVEFCGDAAGLGEALAGLPAIPLKVTSADGQTIEAEKR